MKLFRHENRIYEKTVEGVNIQVVERGDQRELRFGNYIVQSARSLTAPDVLVLDYTRAMMAGFLFAPQALRILHVGLGGGSLPSFIHTHVPEARQRVVEMNPGVTEVAFRYFDLPVSNRLEVLTLDGAEFFRTDPQRYDLIFMDAFHADGADPEMNTARVFQQVRERLGPGGWLVNNTWGSNAEVLKRVRGHMRAVFAQMAAIPVRVDSNVIFICSPEAQFPALPLLNRRAERLSARFPLDFPSLVHRLRPLTHTPESGAHISIAGP